MRATRVKSSRGVNTRAKIGFVTKRQAALSVVEERPGDSHISFMCGYHGEFNDEPLSGGEGVELEAVHGTLG